MTRTPVPIRSAFTLHALLAALALVAGPVGCDGKWSVNKTSVVRIANGSYDVAVKVNGHPEVKRSYAFPVEVKTDKATENGVERTQVTITRKEGGAVVEQIRL